MSSDPPIRPSLGWSLSAITVGLLVAFLAFGAQVIVAAPGPGAFLIPLASLAFAIWLTVLGIVSIPKSNLRAGLRRWIIAGVGVFVVLVLVLSFGS